MKFDNRNTGRIGEGLAEDFLRVKGYQNIMRNYSTRFGEIDLICMDKDQMVFVEVKAKKTLFFGTPEEMFTRGKYNKVKRMATVYLNGKEVNCRIDMVAIELNNDNTLKNLRHYKNVVF